MKKIKFIPAILSLSILYPIAAPAYTLQTRHSEFTQTNEQEVKVHLDVSFGSITLERGSGSQIAVVEYDEETTAKEKLDVTYEVSDKVGTLSIRLKESTHFWGDDEDHHTRRHLLLQLTEALPISFNIELGAGDGEIDLTGLQVKEFSISTGASKVELKCDKPNPVILESVSIESGVSKFSASNLGNLNFRDLKFSGGVGSYKLDFNGTFLQGAKARIEVGLGSLNVTLPKSLPAQLNYEDHWFSSFNIDDDFENTEDGVYETKTYQHSSKRLALFIESGLGSVRIRRK